MFEKVRKSVNRVLLYSILIEVALTFINNMRAISQYAEITGVLRWLEVISCALMYVFSLVEEKKERGSVHIVSIILSVGAVLWLFIRAYTVSVYLMLFGQCILYVYLLWTDYRSYDKLNLKLLTVAILSSAIGYVDAIASNKLVKVFDIIVSVIVLLVFADKYLGAIADASREKRSAVDSEVEGEKLPFKKKLLALLIGKRNMK